MPIYLVNLSLRGQRSQYGSLTQTLAGAHVCRLTEATWLVDVSQSVGDLTKALLTHVSPSDQLLVIEFRPELPWSATGMDEHAKAWMRARLPRVTTGTVAARSTG